MIILGLDISSVNTGWAILKHGKFYKRENVDYGLIKTDSKAGIGKRLNTFYNQLVSVVCEYKVDVVGMEDSFLSINPKTFKILNRFSGVACQVVRQYLGVEPYLMQVKEIRSIWGTQEKKGIFKEITEKYKLDTFEYSKHNDIIDALAVAIYVHKEIKV